MKTIQVKDLMIPVSQYATVSQEATLFEAVQALKEAQDAFNSKLYPFRAILVCDKAGKVVGKVSQMDVLRSLEPKYEEIGDMNAISRIGFSREFVKSMLKNYGLWEKPLQDICRKAAQKKVLEIMDSPSKGEFVTAEATVEQAIHQLIMGSHQSLLVTEGEEIVGILRLTDVFETVSDAMRECGLKG